jgi:hypothetical protein
MLASWRSGFAPVLFRPARSLHGDGRAVFVPGLTKLLCHYVNVT